MSDQESNLFDQGIRRYLNDDQLNKIQSVKVGIAGAGGLGSNCATALVRSGFCNLKICDFDKVEPSNLNRQFYFADQVGRTKVEALAENLKRINPAINLETLCCRITADNIQDIFADCQIVVEAFDGAEDKKMLIQSMYKSGKLLVAASGLAGWGNSDRMKSLKINESFFMVGDQETEADMNCPPCAPRVNIAASKQADIVLEWVLSQ